MQQFKESDFLIIPTMLVRYGCGIKFNVYTRFGKNFILYAKHGHLTEAHKQKLYNNDVTELFIHMEDKMTYDEYVETNFADILQDERIPADERSKMLYTYSVNLSKSLFDFDESNLPNNDNQSKIIKLVDHTYDYLSKQKGAVQSIGKLLSHNYKTYSHCVNVSLYVITFLVKLQYDRAMSRLIGVGANLHDIGKLRVPKAILDKPGSLTDEERKIINNHPVDGLVICQQMHLDKVTNDCVVFHHEKLDGSGYPAGARTIPEHVRIVTICDIYDALTSVRPYGKVHTPFEAMKIILKDVESGKLDKPLCAEFIKMLSSDNMTV